MSAEITPERLHVLGTKYVSEKGLVLLEDMIEEGDIQGAKEFLLGALDSLCDKGKLISEESTPLYEEIGVTPERAALLRQNRTVL